MRRFATVGYVCVLTVLSGTAPAADPATEARLKAVAEELRAWGKDPVFVKAVLAQNAKKTALAEIQRLDKAWIDGAPQEALVNELLSGPCAVRLKALVAKNPAFAESFVMDDQGANVCMTQKTSDYWQGDEAKWQKSFNGGKGTVFIEDARYDTSAKAIVAKVSVPVLDGSRTIGAICVGVRTDGLEKTPPARAKKS